MFTGIVEERGNVTSVKPGSRSAGITIRADEIMADLKIGDSVSTNGVCLTVTRIVDKEFTVDVIPETMRTTTLGELRAGSAVNLERAMPATGRFGGHFVSGHIDGTGRIIRRWQEDNAIWFSISADRELLRFILHRGSVAIDGISLTVARVDQHSFDVSVIPHTRLVTTLSEQQQGGQVNIEYDLLGKYVEKLMKFSGKEGISMDKITQYGF